jgi:hypothetical protein
VLALAAFWGGTQLFSEMATRGILAKKIQAPPRVAAAPEGGDAAEADGVAIPIEPVVEQPALPERVDGAMMQRPRPVQPSSPWDYVALTIAGLLAYELGRGSAPSLPKGPVVPPPDAT